ncbi:MAG: IPTL-CTERM sorting domain-containing protein [Bryobacteraceae bacterium]
MKRHHVALFAVLMLVLAALPAGAQTQGFLLGEGPGKLVDSLIATGYGSVNLYQTLVAIQQNTNPTTAGVITDAFLNTLQTCPAGSVIFTNKLSAYAGNGVVVSANCTAVAVASLKPSSYNGLAGTTTLSTTINGVGPAAVISSTSAAPIEVLVSDGTRNYYTCSVSSPGPTCISVFGMAYAPSGPSQSYVLSDEAPGHLIAALVAAGYGNYGMYMALVAIQQNTDPSLAGVITPAFLAGLQNCAAGDTLFTVPLKNLSYSGSALAVSDDCSVQTVSVQGSPFNGKAGTTSLPVTISGVGPAADVASTSSTPLTSWNQSVPVGSGTATVTYNAFAILYTPGSTSTPVTTPTLSQWGLLLLAGLLAGAGALGLRRGTRHATAAHR